MTRLARSQLVVIREDKKPSAAAKGKLISGIGGLSVTEAVGFIESWTAHDSRTSEVCGEVPGIMRR